MPIYTQTLSTGQHSIPGGTNVCVVRSDMTAGFQFDLCKRNQFLESKGVQGVSVTKTGTTIAGLVFKVSYSHILCFQ